MSVQRMHSTLRQFLLVLAATSALAGLVSCSSSSGAGSNAQSPSAASPSSPSPAGPLSETYPNAIAVMGHSGTTGYNSDPSNPGLDANENSWATGENPAVNSIYSRLLALNPAIEGHNTTLGVDGSNIDNLASQVDQALALKPVPDLFMIQEVDNDMRCNGTDPDNYEPFAQTLATELTRIVGTAPKATILLVSSPPGTAQNYGEVVTELGGVPRLKNTGTGPCDMFNPSGKAVPAHWRYQDKVIKAYQAKLADVCKQFPTCIYDGGALYRMVITADDLAPDGQHLSIAGHAKQAALEWRILGLDS
jgi:GDSL-like Lipase/Acylhydrolase family